MPQEHVHDRDATHSHALAHSHLEFHQHAETHLESPGDHDNPEMGADDERVVWVASVSVNQRAFHLAPDLAVVDETIVPAPISTSATRQPDIDSSPPHGPPRSSYLLRGPPLAA